MTTVLVAEDEALLRAALVSFIGHAEGVDVVAECANGAEAVAAYARLSPDVVVLDLEMPVLDGVDAATAILAARPDAAVLIVTRHARPGVLRRALRAGVRGFLSKDVGPGKLLEVVEELAAGRRYVDPDITAAAMSDDSPLTDRESELLELTELGMSVREMAAALHLAPGTVRNYLSTAMAKTGTSSRLSAARSARARGWA